MEGLVISTTLATITVDQGEFDDILDAVHARDHLSRQRTRTADPADENRFFDGVEPITIAVVVNGETSTWDVVRTETGGTYGDTAIWLREPETDEERPYSQYIYLTLPGEPRLVPVFTVDDTDTDPNSPELKAALEDALAKAGKDLRGE